MPLFQRAKHKRLGQEQEEHHLTFLQRFHSAVSNAFFRVKEDINQLFTWINFLNERSKSQESKLLDLESKYTLLSKQIDQLAAQLNSLSLTQKQSQNQDPDLKPILERITLILDQLQNKQSKATNLTQQTKERQKKKLKSELQAKERIAKRIVKHSKDYIKNLILNLLTRYPGSTAFQLKEIIVDEQALCSKSTFYRLLSELEKEGKITQTKRKKRKKTYSLNTRKLYK